VYEFVLIDLIFYTIFFIQRSNEHKKEARTRKGHSQNMKIIDRMLSRQNKRKLRKSLKAAGLRNATQFPGLDHPWR